MAVVERVSTARVGSLFDISLAIMDETEAVMEFKQGGGKFTSTLAQLWRDMSEGRLSAAQRGLLALPPNVSTVFNFDAEACLVLDDEVESVSGKMELPIGSPVNQVLTTSKSTRVILVDPEDVCLGVLGAVECKKRGDPVVKACALPSKGKNRCVNITHVKTRLDVKAPRIMIEVPKVRSTSKPTVLSIPYLLLSELPDEFFEEGKGWDTMREL